MCWAGKTRERFATSTSSVLKPLKRYVRRSGSGALRIHAFLIPHHKTSSFVPQRKSSLLVEYRQLRKSNAFIDRRFGEDDDTLTPDERALLRFQKQRLKDLSGSKFTLPDDDNDPAANGPEDQLTHLGQSLAELDTYTGFGFGYDDDGDDANHYDKRHDKELTEKLHFGGGFVPVPPRGTNGASRDDARQEREEEERQKTRKEVMEEIIAKSKMHKALKSQQREEDITATEALDDAWKTLAQGGLLAQLMRPKGSKDSNNNKDNKTNGAAVEDSDKRFDVLTKELVFEAKAQPGERTLTAEELVELEKARLEELEKQRLKRQRASEVGGGDVIGGGGGDDLEDDFGGGGSDDGVGGGGGIWAEGGGYAARRARVARLQEEKERKMKRKRGHDCESESGSEDEAEDESEEEEEEEEGLTALERRRRERAAGDHPLQEAFRGVAAQLLAKHGLEAAENSSDGSDSDSDDSEEEEEEGAEDEEEEEEKEEEEKLAQQSKEKQPQPQTHTETLTFTPPLPQSYEEFAAMATNLSAHDLGELLSRIRGFNATALATDGRKKTQILYGCLMQHYVTLSAAITSASAMAHLDALLPHILDLTPQVPFYAAMLGRRRLERAYQEMTTRLRNPVLRAHAWPAPRTLLLLKLFTILYPVSDKRHPVLTPASVLICSALALCPITRPHDVYTGLFLACLAVDMHASSHRYCREPLDFAVAVLLTFVLGEREQEDGLVLPFSLALEDGDDGMEILPEDEGDVVQLSFSSLLSSSSLTSSNGHSLQPASLKCSLVAAALSIIRRINESLTNLDALPEIMQPAMEVLRAISAQVKAQAKSSTKKSHKGKKLPKHDATATIVALRIAPGVAKMADNVLKELEMSVAAATAHRRPLFNPTLVAVPETKQYNPRYEENYAQGKDYDPDRERSDRRRLQRQLRKEERGATRELRRDAAFMAGVRDKERAALHKELDGSAKRAMAFLQQQQADAASGGQGGMWKKGRKLK